MWMAILKSKINGKHSENFLKNANKQQPTENHQLHF